MTAKQRTEGPRIPKRHPLADPGQQRATHAGHSLGTAKAQVAPRHPRATATAGVAGGLQAYPWENLPQLGQPPQQHHAGCLLFPQALALEGCRWVLVFTSDIETFPEMLSKLVVTKWVRLAGAL